MFGSRKYSNTVLYIDLFPRTTPAISQPREFCLWRKKLVSVKPTLYLQSSPPETMRLLTGFQSMVRMMPSWAFHCRNNTARSQHLQSSTSTHPHSQRRRTHHHTLQGHNTYRVPPAHTLTHNADARIVTLCKVTTLYRVPPANTLPHNTDACIVTLCKVTTLFIGFHQHSQCRHTHHDTLQGHNTS